MTILITIWIILFIAFIYVVYQIKRNEAVFKIRMKWINTYQFNRHDRWSYEYMVDPNKSNWYGLKYPKEKDYK